MPHIIKSQVPCSSLDPTSKPYYVNNIMKRFLGSVIFIGLLGLSLFIFIKYYGYIFADNVEGLVLDIREISSDSPASPPSLSKETDDSSSFTISVKNQDG